MVRYSYSLENHYRIYHDIHWHFLLCALLYFCFYPYIFLSLDLKST